MDFLFSSSPKSARGLAQSKTLARSMGPALVRQRLGVRRPSAAFARALYEGDWKLITDIKDQPAALHDLKNDLAERHNLIADPAQAARVKAMEKIYRDLRASKRSRNTP